MIRRGFTLIEAITTLVVLAIICGAASRITFQSFQVLNDASVRSDMANQLAAGMERIANEIRTLEADSGTTPPTPYITACTASSITFKNTSGSNRTLTLSGSNIVLTGAAAATQNLASNVTTFTVQTYDEDGTALPASPSGAQIDTIRRIQVTITATSGGMTETLRTKFYLRCMALGSGST